MYSPKDFYFKSSTNYVSDFGRKNLRFFADDAAKKWPLSGQQESGHLAIPCGVT